MRALTDNDVLLKGAAYGLLEQLLAPYTDSAVGVGPGVLATAKYVVERRLPRMTLSREATVALAAFRAFLPNCAILEPTDQELRLAADIEAHGQRLGLNLDVGESQLCAIGAMRLVPRLLTGDKRAICSMELLIGTSPAISGLCGKVRCLEQIFADAVQLAELASIRSSVCAEPSVDKALTICFACTSPKATLEDITAGLGSYIEDLRWRTARILSP